MPFNLKKISPIGSTAASGNISSHYSYTSPDSLADVLAPDYFNEAAKFLKLGDHIILDVADSKEALYVDAVTINPDFVRVAEVSGGSSQEKVHIITEPNLNVIPFYANKFVVMRRADPQAVHLIPENFVIGDEVQFIRDGNGTVTFDAQGVTVESRAGLLTINARYSAVSLKYIETDVWRLIGDLA